MKYVILFVSFLLAVVAAKTGHSWQILPLAFATITAIALAPAFFDGAKTDDLELSGLLGIPLFFATLIVELLVLVIGAFAK